MARLRSGPPIGHASTKISPLLAVSNPAMIRSRVDLPQPEAPTKATNSPQAKLNETSASAGALLRSKHLPSALTMSLGLMSGARRPKETVVDGGIAILGRFRGRSFLSGGCRQRYGRSAKNAVP